MNATSGPTYGKQFATYDHDSSSWKMWPATGLWGSIAYSETWPKTGFMSDGQAFELPTLVPPHHRERLFILATPADTEGSRRDHGTASHVGPPNREVDAPRDDSHAAADTGVGQVRGCDPPLGAPHASSPGPDRTQPERPAAPECGFR